MNTKYFLLYDDSGYMKFLNDKVVVYNDISQIDLETINYLKEEFIANNKLDNQSTIIIAKVNLNKEKEYYNVSLYNPLFKTKNMNDNRFNQIKKIILDRLTKVVNKEKIKLLDESDLFHFLLNSIFREIITDKDMKYTLTSPRSNINLKVKEEILQMDKDFNWHVSKTYSILNTYMEFRKLLLEFNNYYEKNLIQYLYTPENYLFPSEIFDYQTSFYINPYEASNDLEKKLDREQLDKEFIIFQDLLRIKTACFDDEEIGNVFKISGLPGVMKNFEGDRIYSSTKDDLLRLGIISDEEYLKFKNNSLKP